MKTIWVPVKTVSEANLRQHWAARARRVKSQRTQVDWMLKTVERPSLPCVVKLTRIAPRSLDGDNLQSSLKAVRDSVAAWIGVDDADPRVRWRYAQVSGRPKEYAVSVEVDA